ncbi:MAG: extracellular solute-binding protein [Eisenbergiella sp.]
MFSGIRTQMIADMIESGKVKAIDEDIEKYMPDRLKEIYDKYPQTFYPVIKDGKTYGIACTPFLTEGQVMIIRQDWLDKLGLKAPTTLDEFEEVIRAFTEQDPDGNGKKDTYGLLTQATVFTIPDGLRIPLSFFGECRKIIRKLAGG